MVDTSAWIEFLFGSELGDTSTALANADLSARHQLATADAIVYATALAHGAALLTCDRHFENLPGVFYVAEKGR